MELNHIQLINDILVEGNRRAAMGTEKKIHFEVIEYWFAATTNEVKDLGCFIEYFKRKGKNPIWICANVYHDMSGTATNDKCFLPRSNGFAEKLEAEVGCKC
jgi:hypothetical protein